MISGAGPTVLVLARTAQAEALTTEVVHGFRVIQTRVSSGARVVRHDLASR